MLLHGESSWEVAYLVINFYFIHSALKYRDRSSSKHCLTGWETQGRREVARGGGGGKTFPGGYMTSCNFPKGTYSVNCKNNLGYAIYCKTLCHLGTRGKTPPPPLLGGSGETEIFYRQGEFMCFISSHFSHQ